MCLKQLKKKNIENVSVKKVKENIDNIIEFDNDKTVIEKLIIAIYDLVYELSVCQGDHL